MQVHCLKSISYFYKKTESYEKNDAPYLACQH